MNMLFLKELLMNRNRRLNRRLLERRKAFSDWRGTVTHFRAGAGH
jgi:hypothetical protein